MTSKKKVKPDSRIKIKNKTGKSIHLEISSVNSQPIAPRHLGPDTMIHSGSYFSPSEHKDLWSAIHAYKAWLAGHADLLPLKEYVVTFAHANYTGESPRHVILVKKPPGTMHAGLYNLPGGSVRQKESPETAAIRKFAVETGIPAELVTFPSVIGAIIPSEWDWDSHRPPEDAQPPFIVYVVQATIPGSASIDGDNSHAPGWSLIGSVNDPSVFVPGLSVLLPLCQSGIKGFIIQDGWSSGDYGPNQASLSEVVTFYSSYQRHKKRQERFNT